MRTYSGTTEFEGATVVTASFKGATLRFSDVSGVAMRSVDVDGLDIDSHDLFFGSLIANGVDVVPLVDAELNRQFPGRELQKAQTPEDTSIFREDPPVYAQILAVRAERQRQVTDFLATTTAELLAEEREDPWGGGDWRPTVGDCIRVILEEEWVHLRYIRRDLSSA